MAETHQGKKHLGVLKFNRDTGFRTILSVDGGGLRGLIPAALLEGVEDAIKELVREYGLEGTDANGTRVKPGAEDEFDVLLADYFDVIAGTSTGSIVAAYISSKGGQATVLHDSLEFKKAAADAEEVKALVGGETPPQRPYLESDADAETAPKSPAGTATAAQALFLSQALSIFPRRGPFSYVREIFRPKYPAHYEKDGKQMGVEAVLQNSFGSETLMADAGVLHTNLVVTSYQLNYDRPFLFFYSTPDAKSENGDNGSSGGGPPPRGQSGYASLRRTLTPAQEGAVARRGGLEHKGLSDLVRVPDQRFKLWQIIRASTAAPTFFPTADVDNLGDSEGRKSDSLASYQMTDGGMVANNPSMAALTFASSRYNTKFVGVEDAHGVKGPSLAVLSLGCGTSCEISNVNKYDGLAGWAFPALAILQSGAGELQAALNQQLAREWPGRQKYQFLRLQLTAGKAKLTVTEANGREKQVLYETLTYGRDNIPVSQSEDVNRGLSDEDKAHAAPFLRALYSKTKGKYLSANSVLSNMDVVDEGPQLLGLGVAMTRDEHTKKRLREWVQRFVLPLPDPARRSSQVPGASAAPATAAEPADGSQ